MAGHTDSIEAISFVSQLPLIATCSVDGDLRIWETSTFAPRATCHHHEASICHTLRLLHGSFSVCIPNKMELRRR